MRKKFIRRFTAAALALNTLTFTPNFYIFNPMSVACAQVETYEGVGEYIGSYKETPEFAEKTATEYALRNAQEQSGFLFKGFSDMKNNALKDEVTVVASNVMKIVNKKVEKISLSGEAAGYTKYRVTVKVNIYSNELENELEEFSKRNEDEKKDLVEKNKALQKMLEEANKRNAELEKLIVNAKTSEDKAKIEDKAAMVTNDAQVIERYAEGNKFSYEQKYNQAIDSYGDALKNKIYEVEGEGEYIQDSLTTGAIAKERAREKALRNAIEKIGVIIKSENKSLDIYAITVALQIIDTKFVTEIVEIGKVPVLIHKAIVKAKINPNEVDKWVENMKRNVN